MINKSRVLDEFFELCRVYSPTGGERRMADILTAKLTAIGLFVQEDDVGAALGSDTGNLFAWLPGNMTTGNMATSGGATGGGAQGQEGGKSVPALMFSAHMDCVEPCANIRPRLEGGRIVSGGDTILGADCRSGIVPILEALRVLAETGEPHGAVQAVFTVAEEGGVNGSRRMDPARLRADMGFVLDTTGAPGKIVTAAPGKNRIEVAVHGRKAHAGIAPEEGVNAIVAAAKALARVPQGRVDQETTMNVGMIAGGHTTNVVPDLAIVTLEARSLSEARLEELTALIRHTFEDTAAANGARAVVTVARDYSPYALSPDAPQLALARRAMEALGITPRPMSTGGGSDANFFNAYGLPTAVLSTGMAKAHTLEEHLHERDLYATCELTLALIRAAAGV